MKGARDSYKTQLREKQKEVDALKTKNSTLANADTRVKDLEAQLKLYTNFFSTVKNAAMTIETGGKCIAH